MGEIAYGEVPEVVLLHAFVVLYLYGSVDIGFGKGREDEGGKGAEHWLCSGRLAL